MKRSDINRAIEKAIALMRREKFHLPPFAFWAPRDWAARAAAADELRACGLGWDITDFGSNRFRRIGLLLFTIRNGHLTHPRYKHKTFCEKIMVAEEDQVTPMHSHWKKVEDIINRGGGRLAIRFYNATPSGGLARTRVSVSVDGLRRTLPAGGLLTLKPGESVSIPRGLYHKFWAARGHGPVLIGEVSAINDDARDNRFYDKIGRFPRIEEDEPPKHLLFSDYPR